MHRACACMPAGRSRCFGSSPSKLQAFGARRAGLQASSTIRFLHLILTALFFTSHNVGRHARRRAGEDVELLSRVRHGMPWHVRRHPRLSPKTGDTDVPRIDVGGETGTEPEI